MLKITEKHVFQQFSCLKKTHWVSQQLSTGSPRASLVGFAVLSERSELSAAFEGRLIVPLGWSCLVAHPPQSGQLGPYDAHILLGPLSRTLQAPQVLHGPLVTLDA